MAYWNVLPAENGQESNLGVVPVWGFADVTDSRHEAIGPGERVLGFFPMATHAVLLPVKLTDHSFVDATEHRKRSEEHTYELQALLRIPHAVVCLKKNKHIA